MVLKPQTAVYDDYLEKKMRATLEALVEALLVQKPDDIEQFCLEWLMEWQQNNDEEYQQLGRLKAEQELLASRRDELLSQLGEVQSAVPGSRPASVASTHKVQERAPQRTMSIMSHDEEAAVQALEEEQEQEKIKLMQGKNRRAGVSAPVISQERLKNWKQPFYEKSAEAKDQLKKVIDHNDKLKVLFGHLSDDHVLSVIDAMFPKDMETGGNIITQGEEGDNFYIIESGTFDVFVKRGDADDAGKKVLEYGSGDMFGELALMYNAPRAATVTTTSAAKLWGLDRDSFQMMLSTAENTKAKQYEEFLGSVEILQDLTRYEISRLSDMLESEVFDADEQIIYQGDEGNYFYILEDGDAKAYIGGERGDVEVKHYKTPGEYFGEIALLKSATRKATVRAGKNGCSVLSVSRNDFDLVLGPIQDILAKHVDKYPQYADFLKEHQEAELHEKLEREKIEQMKDSSRRQGISAQAISEERMRAWKKPFFEKSQEVRERIKGIIDGSEKLQVLFGHLSTDAIYPVIDAMKPQSVQQEVNLITQGEEGDNFYIVDEGTFDVFVQRGDNPASKVCEYKAGDMFGELALMYNAPRQATVVATSDAKMWALDRESFQLMLTTAENVRKSRYEEFLGNIELFQQLTRYELAQLSDLLEVEVFEAGENILQQGEPGNYFYILEDGEAKAYINGDKGEIEVKHYKEPGQFFGEVSLILQESRRATVRATGDGCSVLSASREDFDRVLGPIRDILSKDIDKYPNYADVIRSLDT